MSAESIDRLDRKLEEVYDNPRHMTTASNSVFTSALRQEVDVNDFLDSIENGSAFNINKFSIASQGNLVDFIHPKYKVMGQSLIDITAGGNGGMASIGRGEFAISFLSNHKAVITKSGRGDIEFNGKYEEIKHNGGKVAVDDKSGNEIFRTFSKIVEEYDPELLKKKDYLPNRKSDKKIYSTEEKEKLNAIYWEAITGSPQSPLTDDEFAIKCFKLAFDRLFKNVDSLLVLDEDNNFVRFFNAEDATKFYSDRIDTVRGNFEIRNYQGNPVSFYLGLKEVTA